MTSTAMGRCFLVLGTYIATSVFHWIMVGEDSNNNQSQIAETADNRRGDSILSSITGSLSSSSSSATTLDLQSSSSSSSSRRKNERRTSQAELDRIRYLPGLEWDDEENDGGNRDDTTRTSARHCEPFEQFAGYFHVSSSKHVFYWYVESQRDPQNDPIIFWTNGGPGCSGLLGWGTEHGPYRITGARSSSTTSSRTIHTSSSSGRHQLEQQRLHLNPYSWNQLANVLYVEVPAGVGFSYTDNEIETRTNDTQTAQDNYRLIQEFLQRYPERQRNDFYVASESYGGHYTPQLALEILKHERQRNRQEKYGDDDDDVDQSYEEERINFKGFLVGNPYVDPYTNQITQFDSFYSHGLLAKPLYEKWYDQCRDPHKYTSSKCNKLASDMFRAFGDGINPYALDYPVCHQTYTWHHPDGSSGSSMERNDKGYHGRSLRSRASRQQEQISSTGEREESDDWSYHSTFSSQVHALLNQTGKKPPFQPSHDTYKPCSQVHLEEYLNRLDVQLALHVHRHRDVSWSPCGGVDYSYADVTTPTIELYRSLVEQAMNGEHSLRMLVFSGDDDSICSTAGTQDWVWNLGVAPSDTTFWKPWKVTRQTAGFVTSFDLGSQSQNASLSFATVHGAGHEVPAYRPKEALVLLDKFLNGVW